MAPQVAPHHRYRVREGRALFGVPRRTAHREFLPLNEACGQQRHHRVEPQELGHGARSSSLASKDFPRWQPRERWLNQYDEEEESKLFAELDERLQVICRLLLLTGMRPPQEILHIEKEHVNLSDRAQCYKVDNKTWMIPPRAVFIVKGKGDTRRMIPLNEQAQRILAVLCGDTTTGRWLFVNRQGHRLASIKKGWQAACGRAGIEDLRPYDLRHTFAIRLVDRNVHPFVISTLLGHSMPVSGFGQASRITPGYAHATWDAMQRAVASLELPLISLDSSSVSDKTQTNESENKSRERQIKAG